MNRAQSETNPGPARSGPLDDSAVTEHLQHLKNALSQLAQSRPTPGSSQWAALVKAAYDAGDEFRSEKRRWLDAVDTERRSRAVRVMHRFLLPIATVLGLFGLVALLPGWLSPWWLVLVIPQLVLCLLMWAVEPISPLESTKDRLLGAGALAVAAGASVVIAVSPIHDACAVLPAFLTIGAFFGTDLRPLLAESEELEARP